MAFNCPPLPPLCHLIDEVKKEKSLKKKYKAETWKTISLCESISYTHWSKYSKLTAAKGLGAELGVKGGCTGGLL